MLSCAARTISEMPFVNLSRYVRDAFDVSLPYIEEKPVKSVRSHVLPANQEMREVIGIFVNYCIKTHFDGNMSHAKRIMDIVLATKYKSFERQTFLSKRFVNNNFHVHASYIQHSCDPNCYWFYEGDSIVFKALVPIRKGDIFTTAKNLDVLFLKGPDRRVRLLREEGLACCCLRCLDVNREEYESNLLSPKTINSKNADLVGNRAMNECFSGRMNAFGISKFEKTFVSKLPLGNSARYFTYKSCLPIMWESNRPDLCMHYMKQLNKSLEHWENCKMLKSTNHTRAWAVIMDFVLLFSNVEDHYDSGASMLTLKMKDNQMIPRFIAAGPLCHGVMREAFCDKILEIDILRHPALKRVINIAKCMFFNYVQVDKVDPK